MAASAAAPPSPKAPAPSAPGVGAEDMVAALRAELQVEKIKSEELELKNEELEKRLRAKEGSLAHFPHVH